MKTTSQITNTTHVNVHIDLKNITMHTILKKLAKGLSSARTAPDPPAGGFRRCPGAAGTPEDGSSWKPTLANLRGEGPPPGSAGQLAVQTTLTLHWAIERFTEVNAAARGCSTFKNVIKINLKIKILTQFDCISKRRVRMSLILVGSFKCRKIYRT